jgi:hypothetical protein
MLKAKQIIDNPRSYLSLYSDFVFNSGDWSVSNSGTGSGSSYVGNFPGRCGVLRLAPGTATGWARIGDTINGILTYFDVGNWYYRSSIMLPVLSNATDSYYLGVGFMQQTNFANNQLMVKYSDASPNFETLIRTTGNADIIIPSGVPAVANTWYNIELEVVNSGTQVITRINDVVSSLTTTLAQLPSTLTNPGQFIQNIAGSSAARFMNVDYTQLACRFNSPR